MVHVPPCFAVCSRGACGRCANVLAVDLDVAVHQAKIDAAIDTAEHRALARTVAEEGIVMLKNDPIPASSTSPGNAAAAFLPLQGLGTAIKTIAVIGPNANNSHSQQGGYTNEGAAVVTVLDAAVAAANASGNSFKIEYERGACVGATPGCDCPVLPDPAAPLCGIFNTSRVPTAASVAAAADLVVLVLGDSSTIMATGTCPHHVLERVQTIAHCGSLLNCTIAWRCYHCILSY